MTIAIDIKPPDAPNTVLGDCVTEWSELDPGEEIAMRGDDFRWPLRAGYWAGYSDGAFIAFLYEPDGKLQRHCFVAPKEVANYTSQATHDFYFRSRGVSPQHACPFS